ncbi:hypothetical protein MRX96_019105 [Rhipicephalus microplus]
MLATLSTSRRPTPRRTSRSREGQKKRPNCSSVPIIKAGKRRTSATNRARHTEQTAAKYSENYDYDRMLPQNRGHPHLLQSQVVRIPGKESPMPTLKALETPEMFR